MDQRNRNCSLGWISTKMIVWVSIEKKCTIFSGLFDFWIFFSILGGVIYYFFSIFPDFSIFYYFFFQILNFFDFFFKISIFSTFFRVIYPSITYSFSGPTNINTTIIRQEYTYTELINAVVDPAMIWCNGLRRIFYYAGDLQKWRHVTWPV